MARRVVGLGDARKEVAAIGKLYNELYAKPLGPLREADVAGVQPLDDVRRFINVLKLKEIQRSLRQWIR